MEICFKNVTIARIPPKFELFKAKILRKPPTSKLVILDSVSGKFPKETFTIIMGSSGAGKTTFLNFIS